MVGTEIGQQRAVERAPRRERPHQRFAVDHRVKRAEILPAVSGGADLLGMLFAAFGEPAHGLGIQDEATAEQVDIRLLKLHDLLYKKSSSRIGPQIPGVPPSLLHTVGAKTGQPRSNTLTSARDGQTYLIVASLGGAPRSSGWYHNL